MNVSTMSMSMMILEGTHGAILMTWSVENASLSTSMLNKLVHATSKEISEVSGLQEEVSLLKLKSSRSSEQKS